ncbi:MULTISPECIES: hypothetical protein [unclassified Butyrivibrio]|uniref:hypothetical protein n=1 Tax=unclassified Butyrivibrio TaxID=2639466 RepID=UPI00040AEEC6|nr:MULTISPECIES: hypothetical protein [unclassified Butyrivibrio]
MKKEFMKSSVAVISVIMTLSVLSGCGAGGNTSKLTTSSIEINKDGSVVSTIIDDFAESYYNLDELKEMTENEVNSFIVSKGEGAAELKSVDLNDGKVKLVIKFSDVDNYADFNSEYLAYETVTDAVLSGQLDVNTLVDKDGIAIDPDKAAVLSDQHVIITKSANIIAAPYKVKYFAGKAKAYNKYMADMSDNVDGEIACVVLEK